MWKESEDICSFPHIPICFLKFSRGARNRRQGDLDGTLFFLSHLPRTHRKEQARIYCACTHDSIYRLGINWSRWMLMEGEELFGCLCLYCFLLWTALGSVTGTRQWLNQRGALRCFDWVLTYWRTLYWTSDFKTHFVQCHDQGQRPTNQMVEYVNKWQMEKGKYGQKITERRRRRSNVLQTVNAEHVGLYFVPDNAHSLLISQLWLSDLRTSACCSDTPTLSEKYLFCLNNKSYRH